MAHGRARDEEKERQWRRWIGEWQASGLSVRASCQRRGLTVASFYAWRRVLQRRDAERARFVPVQVLADAALALAPADLRKGFDALAELVRQYLHDDPLSGHVFVFRNRRGDRIKLLYWDTDG